MTKVMWDYEEHCYCLTTGEIIPAFAEIPPKLWDLYCSVLRDKEAVEKEIGAYANDQ